jgi:hypothetical protein
MNKRVVSFMAVAGLTIGGLIPVFLGWDPTGLGGASIVGGLIGGILAIWLTYVVAKFLNL